VEFRQEFDDLGEFVAAYRGKISREGMILVTDKPYPAGTQLEVEIRLSDSLALVRGKGEVLGPAAAGEPGVAVRFSLLDDQSADLIDRLERRYVNEGGKPFRIDEATASRPKAQEPTLFDQPLQPSPGAGPGPPRAPEVASIVDPVTRAISGSEAKPTSSGAKRKGKKAKRTKVPKDLLPEGMKAAAGQRTRSARLAVIVGLLVIIGGGLGGVLWFLQQRQAEPAPEQPAADAASAVETPADAVAVENESEAAGDAPDSAGFEPAATRPEPGPAAQPAATRRAPARSGRAIERIDWSEQGGVTVVTIAANGPLSADSYRHMRLDNPPRCVLRLVDIRHAYPELVLEVGGPRLQRIRTWHHADKHPPELHVVLDLAHPGVGQQGISASGKGLEITLGTGP
jgi:hypothetical protein